MAITSFPNQNLTPKSPLKRSIRILILVPIILIPCHHGCRVPLPLLLPLLLLLLFLLLLLLTLIENLLLQNDTVHTGLEQGTDGGGFALEEAQAVEGEGGGGAGKVGEFVGELRRVC